MRDVDALNSISEILEGALAALPGGHEHRSIVLVVLAYSCAAQYMQEKTPVNLNHFVEAAENALAAAQPGSPHRAGLFN